MKVAMYAPVGENSEIATYSENLTIALQKLPFLEVVTVPILVGKQSLAHYVEVAEKLNSDDIDLIHLQHEPYFWGEITPDGSAFWQMRYLLKKPLVLTAHNTSSLAEMLRKKEKRTPLERLHAEWLIRKKAYRDSVEIAPYATALTIVHSEAERDVLLSRGAKPNYVAIILPSQEMNRVARLTRNVYTRAIELFSPGNW
ncbi:MAG: glycosyltransferase [Chthonomonadaceae bacterium]|nr:glycosyltransferase [Chthonomonadaceae bacterium]